MKHTLVNGGKIFNNGKWTVSLGGCVRCSCGWQSCYSELSTIRRRWFMEHKQEAAKKEAPHV